MTRQDAEHALSEMEAHARLEEDQSLSEKIQGRWLEVEHMLDETIRYRYGGEIVTREAAVTIFQNR